jgi:hypothetical protein
MRGEPFTILDDGRATEVSASTTDGRVVLDADAVERALGWSVTDDGLCRDGLCVPTPPTWSTTAGGTVLEDLADVLGRPLAVDLGERAAWLGVAADERARTLHTLTAPDFALRDLEGRVHRLADHRGEKVLLVVWASW